MLKVLPSPGVAPFQTPPISPETSLNDSILQKIKALQLEMEVARVKFDQIEQNQTSMKEMALEVQEDFMEIEQEEENVQKIQEEVRVNQLQIVQQQKQMKVCKVTLQQTWSHLFQVVLGIKQDQKTMQSQVVKMEEKRDSINQNMPIIRQILEKADEKLTETESHVEAIEKDQQAMHVEAESIEQKREAIKKKISQPKEEKYGFQWITDICLQIITFVCQAITQTYQWNRLRKISSNLIWIAETCHRLVNSQLITNEG